MKIFMEEKNHHNIELQKTIRPFFIPPILIKNFSSGQNNSGFQIGFFNNKKPSLFFIDFKERYFRPILEPF